MGPTTGEPSQLVCVPALPLFKPPLQATCCSVTQPVMLTVLHSVNPCMQAARQSGRQCCTIHSMCCRFAYFLRNGTTGWRSLGGVVLCITGVSHHLQPYLPASAWCHCMLAGLDEQCTAQLVAGTHPQQILCSPHLSPQSHAGVMARVLRYPPPGTAAPILPARAMRQGVQICQWCLQNDILPATCSTTDRRILGTLCLCHTCCACRLRPSLLTWATLAKTPYRSAPLAYFGRH